MGVSGYKNESNCIWVDRMHSVWLKLRVPAPTRALGLANPVTWWDCLELSKLV